MPSGATDGGGEGLSLQTLIIAACASAAAAVIVSHIWKDGTVVAAAMTPVVVAIVKELLAKPMESELVRKPVSKIASGSRAAIGGAAGIGGRPSAAPGAPRRTSEPGRARAATRGTGDPFTTGTSPPPTERRGPHLDPGPGNGAGPDGQLTPMRTYGRSHRRPLHLKIALATGLIAFLIAAAALTLPELLFGGAVSSHHSTTLFGGGKSKSKSDKGSSTQPDQQKPQDQKTTPAAPAPTEPTSTTPAPTTPQQSPQQTTPQQTSPAPTTPSPPAP